ncbi:hypothetical protein HI914_02926 [Erysiphe necator]|nr:hypothetical protein HI914_02926 [Erysiphe necator]
MTTNKISPESGPAIDSISRCSSSNHTSTGPLPTSPNPQGNQNKTKKHVALTARAHSRNFTNRANHSKTHADSHIEGGANRKPQRNASTLSLMRKNNNQHLHLKRNRSSAEVKPKFAVGFELGDHEDGWEETSSSTSPAASRSNSRPTSKSQSSTTNSQTLLSLPASSEIVNETSTIKKPAQPSVSTQPKGITERLLSRTPCQHTTQTSLEFATPVVNSHSSPSSPNRSVLLNNKKISLFTSNPSSNAGLSNFLFNYSTSKKVEELKRVQSMKDLSNFLPDEDESFLHSYQLGAGQSRTQQKQWLQRASSIMEPKQLDTHYGSEVGLFAGTKFEGPIPRVKSILARTSTEYLVARRFHDPVGNALKRIAQIPGMDRNRRIPSKSKNSVDTTVNSSGSRYGLSQSLRNFTPVRNSTSSASISRGHKNLSAPCDDINDGGQTYLDVRNEPPNTESEEILSLLRKLWDKSPDSITGS